MLTLKESSISLSDDLKEFMRTNTDIQSKAIKKFTDNINEAKEKHLKQYLEDIGLTIEKINGTGKHKFECKTERSLSATQKEYHYHNGVKIITIEYALAVGVITITLNYVEDLKKQVDLELSKIKAE